MEVVIPDSLRERVIKNISFGELIAKGANGTIMEGKWEGSIVVVKKINSVFNEPSEFDFQKRFFEECAGAKLSTSPHKYCPTLGYFYSIWSKSAKFSNETPLLLNDLLGTAYQEKIVPPKIFIFILG